MARKKVYWKNREKLLRKAKEYREKNREKIAIYYKNWYEANGRNRNIDFNIINIEWRLKNPEKYKAHTLLNNAVRDKKIIKPKKCQKCFQSKPLFAHHKDYTQPLEVQWYCGSCHKLIHFGY